MGHASPDIYRYIHVKRIALHDFYSLSIKILKYPDREKTMPQNVEQID